MLLCNRAGLLLFIITHICMRSLDSTNSLSASPSVDIQLVEGPQRRQVRLATLSTRIISVPGYRKRLVSFVNGP
jgi:hypothetical protein